MQYYQRLRDLREDNDIEQKEIAELLGTTQQQISKYENGKQELPLRRAITLARYYNVSLDYITGLIDEPRTLDGKPYNVYKQNNSINIKSTGRDYRITIKK